MGGALMSVRLLDRFEPPAAVVVELLPQGQTQLSRVSGRLQQSIPGQFADYLVALALPPGSYRVQGVRDGRLPASDPDSMLAVLDAPLELGERDPVYLGQMLIRAGASSRAAGQGIRIEDRYDDDIVAFRAAVPQLRDVSIGRALLQPAPTAGASSATKGDIGATGRMEVERLALENVSLLREPARQAFTRFLKLPAPRAFAISDSGAHGQATGRSAVTEALRLCSRQARGQPCRLFAVDQTMLSAASCTATSAAGSGPPTVHPGCAPAREKSP